MINGGTASSLGKMSRFKIIEVDNQYFVPHKITSYVYDVDIASAEPDAPDYNVLFTQMVYPHYFPDMESLAPGEFYKLAKKILDSRIEALSFKG